MKSKYYSILQASTDKRIASIISESLKYRTENNIVGNDFLSALLSLKQAGTITDREIISHVGTLYVDGVETSAFILHYALYEIAAHPEVQENLRRELDEANCDTVTFEVIQGLKYLDAVLNGKDISLNFQILYLAF